MIANLSRAATAVLAVTLCSGESVSQAKNRQAANGKAQGSVAVVGHANCTWKPIPKQGPRTTVLSVLAAQAKNGVDLTRIVLLRFGKSGFVRTSIDAKKMTRTGDTKGNVTLRSRDVLYFHEKRFFGKAVPSNFRILTDVLGLPGKPDPATRTAIWSHLNGLIKREKDRKRVAEYHWAFVEHHLSPIERRKHVLRLGALGGSARGVVPCLIKLLSESDSQGVRGDVITALGMMGTAAKEALPRLRELLKSKHSETRTRSRAAIESITK